ncbi:hypothetical protein G7075_09315 [Phycicoccus sp. HDW14]|uniref:hypothetical protein n=1 Tax=Phycicoccus sp. HDW14 TaxID=2714941 RepID=UPI001409C591|nr:hypothetical protein [Phycicoccus sp. HDW14]QIM21287.1 hypothetical protein G7075_09315 [Phycicoccus sp. HDW14]
MARRRGWVAVVVGALAVAPFVGALPAAEAAGAAASAIVSTGGSSESAWVDDDSNSTMTWEGQRNAVYLTGTHADGSNPSYAWFFVQNGVADLPTSGEHPVSASGPLSLLYSEGSSSSCQVEGTVTVRELTFDGSGSPTSLAVDWTGDCGGSPSGQVRAGSTVPYGGIDVVPTVEFGTVVMGEIAPAKSLVVTGHGSEAPAVTSTEVGAEAGQEPQYVKVHAGDGCTGRTLADHETCAVQLRPAFTRADNRSGSHPFLVHTADGATSRTLLRNDGSWISQRGQLTPLSGRVMDTRKGTGVRKGAVGPGQTVTLKVAGRGVIPSSGTAAAVLNLTVTGSTRAGHVTAYPAGSTRPTASSINFPAGWTGANLVTVPLGSNGSVSFFNNAGSVHLVADLVGVYAKDKVAPLGRNTDFYPHDPTRLFDSRSDWRERLGPNQYFGVRADYGAATNGRVEALAVNITATGTTGTSYLSATDIEPQYGPPSTSTLNYTKGLTAANMAVVPRAASGSPGLEVPTIWIANTGSASTHVIVDVVGYFAQEQEGDLGLRFRPLKPTRVVDTRTDLGLTSIGTNVVKRVQAPTSVAGRETFSLVGNLTGVTPSSNTYLTSWDAGPRPTASNLNLMKGVTRANSAWPGLDTGNGFRLHNAAGTLGVVMDVTGSFERFPQYPETIAGEPFPPVAPGVAREKAAAGGDVRAPKASGGRAPAAHSWVR